MMGYPLIRRRLHAAEFIILPEWLGDDGALFSTLGFAVVQEVSYTRESLRLDIPTAFVVRPTGGGPIQWCDSYRYSLFHDRDRERRLQFLARHADFLLFTLGDVDLSFEYRFYQDGELVRQYRVASPGFSDRIVEVDTGVRLCGERKWRLRDDASDILDELARAMGAKMRLSKDEFRAYTYNASDAWP